MAVPHVSRTPAPTMTYHQGLPAEGLSSTKGSRQPAAWQQQDQPRMSLVGPGSIKQHVLLKTLLVPRWENIQFCLEPTEHSQTTKHATAGMCMFQRR